MWGTSIQEGLYFPLSDAAASRKKGDITTCEQCFSPSLVSAQASPMEVSVTLHSYTFRKQPEDTKYLKGKGCEEAVAEEGTTSEVRPRDPHGFRPSE